MRSTPLEVQAGTLLRQRGLWLALAESCTGGLVSHWITNVPGSSDYYLGGVVAYSNSVKRRLLGVPLEALEQSGAVSRPTVLSMALGARRALAGELTLENTVGVSISGVAGPGGGTPDKPVGTVWIGLSAADGAWAWRFHFSGTRLQNKTSSARAALKLLCGYLRGELPPETQEGA